MNKDVLDQIPAEEQPVASKLNSLVETMQPSEAFQWDLENQLMDKAATARPRKSWLKNFIVPVGWGIAAIAGILLLNWSIRSFAPEPTPAAGMTATQEISFADNVRAGNICTGPLALAHGFDVFLTNEDKTRFVTLDREKSIGEMRSFMWSPDGQQLTIVGNTTGSGNILVTNPTSGKLEYLLSNSNVGYLMDAAWSHDGKHLVMWSSQNNEILYLLNTAGTGLVEKQLDVHILGTPQFSPDDSSLIFFGATSTSSGLFELRLANSEVTLLNPYVEDEKSYAFSPSGSHLAYIEMDRESGESRLVVKELSSGAKTTLGILPIPKGSGSSIPESANLSWSADGTFLVFDFGRNAADKAIYLAHADGTEITKAVASAYAPSISTDGNCLAYISDKQVFLMDLNAVASSSTAQTPVLIADLPSGRGIPNFKQDKLQWKPNP